ncbi:translocation protein TolB [Symmachiella dynata]|uniref:WD40 repeat domain-containing protein n=1 Tax=Symmachiella dynata TaxID=2527995 RepID=UPI00118C237A|nr:WD40 repeat domain-containing protein [Symmachiella dynata]QDT47048.1 translocation protein TolB [Symmachiella dynata]
MSKAKLLFSVCMAGVISLGGGVAFAQRSPLEKPAATEKPQRSWGDFPEWTTAVAFAPDGKSLVVGTYEKLEIVDLAEEGERKSIDLNTGFVHALAFAPDGKLIAAGSYQSVTVIDPATGESRVFKGQRGYVRGVAFSPDGQWLATAAEDESVRIWSVSDGAERLTFANHRLPATSIAVSPDGTLVASTDGDAEQPRKKGTAYIWDATTGEVRATLNGHMRGINGIVFSPDGKQVVTGGTDETVRVWETATGKPVKMLEGHSRPVNALAFSPDGKLLATAGGGRFKGKNNILLWDTATWKVLKTIEAHDARVTDVAFSPDGTQVVTTSYDKSVRLWKVPGGRQ